MLKRNAKGIEEVVRLSPNFYIHVLDTNTNVTRIVLGPITFTRQDHERVLHAIPQPWLSSQASMLVAISSSCMLQERYALLPSACAVGSKYCLVLPVPCALKKVAIDTNVPYWMLGRWYHDTGTTVCCRRAGEVVTAFVVIYLHVPYYILFNTM